MKIQRLFCRYAVAVLIALLLSLPALGQDQHHVGCPRPIVPIKPSDVESGVIDLEAKDAPLTLFNGRLQIGLGASAYWNAFQADQGAFFPVDQDTDSGFERLRFNLELTFNITDNVFAFVDIAEEPNDFRNLDPFSLNQDFGFIDINLTGLAGRTTGPEIHFKAGNIGVGTFDGLHSFSDGSVVQGNPLIGNSPASFGTAQSGVQLVLSNELNGLIESATADIAASIPSFGGESNPGRGYNLLTGIRLDGRNGFAFSTRFFAGAGGDQLTDPVAGAAAGTFSLDGVQQDGLFFGDGDNYFLASNDTDRGDRSSRIFHQGQLPGVDAFILQFNGQYRPTFSEGTLIRAWGGFAESDYSFVDAAGNQTSAGNPNTVGVVEEESTIGFFGIGVQQYLVPDKFYLAGRYTTVNNTTDRVDGGSLQRYQVGAGWFLDKRTLWKVEYVNQDEEDNSPGQIGNGFDGVVTELSVRF